MFSSFPQRHGDATGKPATGDKTCGCRKTSISYETSSNIEILWTSSNRLECHKVPRLPGKTTWQLAWRHSKRDRFSSFPHRHGDATGKPATRDKTRGCRKNSISYETSGNFHSWQHDKRTRFAASPIDTARPRENQTRETRQVEAPTRAFRARLPPIFTLCSFKIDVFLRVFLRTWKFATSKSMFRARPPSIFSTSHKMPRLPRHLHLVATWRSPANAIYKKHATRHV